MGFGVVENGFHRLKKVQNPLSVSPHRGVFVVFPARMRESRRVADLLVDRYGS